jgi:hypothetical protein
LHLIKAISEEVNTVQTQVDLAGGIRLGLTGYVAFKTATPKIAVSLQKYGI